MICPETFREYTTLSDGTRVFTKYARRRHYKRKMKQSATLKKTLAAKRKQATEPNRIIRSFSDLKI